MTIDVTQDSRELAVRAAVAEWTRHLVNLDGRNRMLYFRELTRGTLEITPGTDGVRSDEVERLFTAGSARLSEIFTAEALHDAAARALVLATKARTNFEEKGLATLFIGHSFARWKRPDGRTPRAPIALIPIRIRFDQPGGEHALIEVRGPAVVNPSFVYAMGYDFGRDPYPAPDDLGTDFTQWVAHIRRECASIPEFTVDDSAFLANLEFSRLPIVVDMQDNLDILVASDMVAAMAGDGEAQAALDLGIDASPDLPDHTPPADEYLVCDADASQNQAIVAALRGQSLVIHGPPGTGKSQTIANMIASFAAHGKSVLFVAEKRAAIAAVTRRLDEAGCGELVLDLHDGTGRRDVAKSLAASLKDAPSASAHEVVLPHDELVIARRHLIDHRDRMHRPRDPHGLSYFELQAMLGTPDGEFTGARLSTDDLAKWTPDGRAVVTELLGQWLTVAKQLDDEGSGLWASSVIRDASGAEEVKALVSRLGRVDVPAVDAAYHAAVTQLGLPARKDLSIAELSAVLSTIEKSVGRYGPEFLEAAPGLAADLAPMERSGLLRLIALLINGKFRAAKRVAATMGPATEVFADATEVLAAREWWGWWFPENPMPKRVASAGPLADGLALYRRGLDLLTARVPALAGVSGFRAQEEALLGMGARLDLADACAQLAETATALREFGLGPLLRLSTPRNRADLDLVDMANRLFAASAIDAITWQDPDLAMFNGKSHQQVAERFGNLDRRHTVANADRVIRLVAKRATEVMKERPRETILVQYEADATAHLMPVRQLLATAPNVVKSLRPCWAMSPLLVSQMLPAVAGLFDVVIFDEGSQILPIHAIPAIARAGQVVVAGDPHQLPPNEFISSDSVDDDADGDDAAGGITDRESILDVMRQLVPERNLLWHYRSQDERLINFSNAHIYDRSLVSFPGTKRGTGLELVLVEGAPKTSEDTASNPQVVKEVVALILAHAKRHPEESLGVIALGSRHAADISSALLAARLEADEDFGGFFDDKGAEPVFVKVTREAQGDERDHIILSVGYGRNPDGDIVYRWGVLNRKGGERRLNVAVTRAKRRLTVVSSISPAEIDRSRARAQGASLLVDYLEYASHGGESIRGPDMAPLSPFEQSVSQHLSAAGIPIETHYGGGRLRIDVAAFDSKDKQRPVLAIETDGLAYNSSATARDRDRLRIEVLRKRGWRFYRIWSIDWYRDPEGQCDKVKEAWSQAINESRDPSLHHIGRPSVARPVVPGRGRSPIAVRSVGILGYTREELAKLMRWIESDGEVRTEDELMAAAMEVLGFEDSRGRIGRALRGAIKESRE